MIKFLMTHKRTGRLSVSRILLSPEVALRYKLVSGLAKIIAPPRVDELNTGNSIPFTNNETIRRRDPDARHSLGILAASICRHVRHRYRGRKRVRYFPAGWPKVSTKPLSFWSLLINVTHVTLEPRRSTAKLTIIVLSSSTGSYKHTMRKYHHFPPSVHGALSL